MAPAFLVGMVIVVQQFQRDSGSDAGSWIYGFRKCEFAVVFSFLIFFYQEAMSKIIR